MDGVGRFASGAGRLSSSSIGDHRPVHRPDYGFATMLVFAGALTPAERSPLIWFLVTFPVLVLVVFAWLVRSHHEKLYSPKDFTSDASFLQSLAARRTRQVEAVQFENTTASLIKEVLTSPEVVALVGTSKSETKAKLATTADDLVRQIRESSSVTIDARRFTSNENAVYSYPVVSFAVMQELLDEIYFKLMPGVKPYTYGSHWISGMPLQTSNAQSSKTRCPHAK